MKTPLALALLISLAAASHAAGIDDSDFSQPAISAQSAAGLALEGRLERKTRVFQLDALGPSDVSVKGAVTGRLILLDRAGAPHPGRLAKVSLEGGAWTQVGDDGRFSLNAPAGGTFKIRVSLDGPRWNFRSDNGDAYEWESAPIAAGSDAGTLMPVAGSENAKLGVLHLTYLEAVDFLTREATIDWWKDPLTVVWPGGSDYFSPGEWTLHLTNPEAWDIVLHELGHAVMNGSMDAHTAGGSHKIDECYSEGLAWGEGWASFFAAAVRLSPDDADAKFEFMVPRRAPIRVENVPADVCQGSASEWRVFSGLWDLYDRHEDGLDKVALGFGPIWKGVTSGSSSSVLDAYKLIAAGLDPATRLLADDAMRQNTLLPAKPASLALPRSLPLTASAVSFDGAR
jgi:hypothetical protein